MTDKYVHYVEYVSTQFKGEVFYTDFTSSNKMETKTKIKAVILEQLKTYKHLPNYMFGLKNVTTLLNR